MTARSTDAAAEVHRLRELREGPRALPEVISLGGRAIPELEALVRDRPGPISEHRRVAIRALRAIGTAAARGALARALSDSISRELDPVLREAEQLVVSDVASALGALGAHDATDLLLHALAIRPNAGCAEALGALGDVRAVPLLVRCLADATVRSAARDALTHFPREAALALAAALPPPTGPEEIEGANSVLTRAVIAEVLGDIPGVESDHALAWALGDPQSAVRIAAALALARRRAAGTSAIEALREALAGERWDLAQEASAALTAMGNQPALQAVVEVARIGSTLLVRQRAIRVLARWPGLEAATALVWLGTDPDPSVRDSVSEALGARPEPIARDALAALARDPVRQVRRRASAALRRDTSGDAATSDR